MDKKKIKQYKKGRDNSKFLVLLALGGAAIAVGVLSFVSYKQFISRRSKKHQYEKTRETVTDEHEEEEESEESDEEVVEDKKVQPPTTKSLANENRIKWWSEIAAEQRIMGDIKGSRFYAIKAIDEMSLDPKYENSITMLEMKFFLATTVNNDEEKEKLLSNLLATMEKLGENVSDEKYYEIKGSIYKDLSDIYFTKEQYVEAKEFSQKCYENFKKGYSKKPNRLDSALAVAKYTMSTINEKLNLLEESEADVSEAFQLALKTKNFQLLLHISNHRTDILSKLNRIDDAINSIKELIEDKSFEKPPTFLANRHHLLATLLFNEKGQYEDAIEHLKEAITIHSNYYPAMSLLVSCYYEIGNEEEARKVSDNLIKDFDLTLSQSKYFITDFMSFTSQKENEPYIFFIQLKMKRDRNKELIIKPGSYIELNIRKYYKSDETRPEDEPIVAEPQTYTIVGDEEEDIISLGSDLIGEHDDRTWYEMIVNVYEDESKEKQIGIHYQLITTTIATIKQYDRMKKWLEQREEAKKLTEQKEEQENIENVIAVEGEEEKKEIPTEGIIEEAQPEEQQTEESQQEETQEEKIEDKVEISTGIIEEEQTIVTSEDTKENLREVLTEETQVEEVNVDEQQQQEPIQTDETKEEETQEQPIEEPEVEKQPVEEPKEEQPVEEPKVEEQPIEEPKEEQPVEEEQPIEELKEEEQPVEGPEVEKQPVEEPEEEEQPVEEPKVEEQPVEEPEEEQPIEELKEEEQPIEEPEVEKQPVEEPKEEEQPIEENKEEIPTEGIIEEAQPEEQQTEESQQEEKIEDKAEEKQTNENMTSEQIEAEGNDEVQDKSESQPLDDLVGDIDDIDYTEVEGHVDEE